MAKKDSKQILGGFSFRKVPEITEGLVIPTGNIIPSDRSIYSKQPVEPISTPKLSKSKKDIILVKKEVQKEVEIDMEAFTPMTNIVPTIKSEKANKSKFKGLSSKAKQRITPDDLNLEEIAALPTKHDKVTYLAMHGWSLKIEQRGNNFYHYATKYIKRKKKRYYLGSIND
jgi:hypothetical protein